MNRDGTLGRFRGIGADGARRTFDTLEEAREFRDREADLTPEQRQSLKPDTVIDRELIEGVLLYLERHDQLAAATINGYRKTARYALYPWIDPDPGTALRPHRWTTRTLTKDQLEEWCADRTEADPAAYTNRVKMALVLGRTLVATRMRIDNPAAGLESRHHVRSAKTIRSRSRRRTATGERLWIPTFGDLLELVDGMPDLYRLWFLFLALTGMRPSEAAGMRWDQGLIDTTNGWIYTSGWHSSPSQVRFASPSGQEVTAIFGDAELVEGDATDGVYVSTVDLPGEAGTWTLEYLLLVDAASNSVQLTREDVADLGLPTEFEATVASVPGVPLEVTAVAGDGQARVSWVAPESDGGSAVSGYTVVASAGGHSVSVDGDTFEATIPGLSNGEAYTFRVSATNAEGASDWSAPSNAVVPAGLPGAPAEVIAVPDDGSVVVSWSVADGNGAAVTSYTVTAAPGGVSVTEDGDTLEAAVVGLSNGTSYSFTVTATNSVGTGSASDPSEPVTPFAPVPTEDAEVFQVEDGGTASASPAGEGPTVSDPVQVGVTSPEAGTVVIGWQESQGTPPDGYGFGGLEFHIRAPDATEESPLVFRFDVHTSVLPDGTVASDLMVFRNGVAAEDCTSATSAVPDPCVAERIIDGEVASIVIRSSRASVWQAAWVEAPADTDPPNTTITSGPTGTVSSTSAQFAFSSSEAGSTFECKLDAGTWEACTSPKSYAGLAQGAHTFQVRATDAADNTDPTPATRTWTVDTIPPETSITSGPSGTGSSTSAQFAFASSEAGSTFQCKLDAGAWAACTSPRSYTGLADGSHTFQVRATDAAGNTDPTPATRTWTVASTPPPDTTKPSWPSGASLTASEITQTSVKLSWPAATDNVGVTRYVVSRSGASPVTVNAPATSVTFSGLTAATSYTFTVTAHDAAGNTSSGLSGKVATAALTEVPGTKTSRRLGGTSDVVNAAIDLSKGTFLDGSAKHVLIGRNDVFADSLAGAALAGKDGPILYTPGGPDARLAAATKAELQRVLGAPGGGRSVYILGGVNAVSQAVEDEVRALGYGVKRFWGDSRVETSVAIANDVMARTGSRRVLLARSDNWADAATGGAYAAVSGVPIVVTPTAALHGATEGFLAAHRPAEILVLGGEAAISGATAAQAAAHGSVRRVWGEARDITAVEIGKQLWSGVSPKPTGVVLVSGWHEMGWAYALAAAVPAAREGSVQLYVQPDVVTTSTQQHLDAYAYKFAVAAGPTSLISETVHRQVTNGASR